MTVNYWLLGLLITSNIALVFYVFRAAELARKLKKQRARFRKLKADHAPASAPEGVAKKVHNPEMLVLLAASPIAGLARYARARLPRQDNMKNVLPPMDCNLDALRDKLVERVDFEVDTPRKDMGNHALRLRSWFAGKSELVYLNAVCIAYLRRRSVHSAHARALFARLWREQGELLIEQNTTRWLISSLMTFMDHGETEKQRLIGAVGAVFGNTVKIYEWERVVRGDFPKGLDLDGVLQTRTEGIPHIGPIAGGNADIFRNMLAHYVDMALRDPVAGRILLTVLIRFYDANTIFGRLDDAKLAVDATPDDEISYNRHWSFGRHPLADDKDADSCKT